MGGIVDDQFVMAVPPRIAAACGFRATPSPAMRDGVCRAQGHVKWLDSRNENLSEKSIHQNYA
jgi:hypothetical protein